MKRSEDYEARFIRLSARVEKLITRFIIGLVLLFIVGQCAVHLLPIRFLLNETVKWEGSAHILQK
ncbi:hypothetical protein EDM56_25140 [Brevibacillus fluminis]|uniref:Uncharacterized protein n=1 Tax=Brevibacillus fluminis TaxID=511487 RepID=A0A3M8D2D3_9BACL|nr:hypothetical protein [Brevibacillus fluminis]RNB81607.1 hypothetical protein EDM56_25140 [Brevibacillus fluminis]